MTQNVVCGGQRRATEQPESLIKINTQRTNVDTPEMLINKKNVGGDGSDDKTKL